MVALCSPRTLPKARAMRRRTGYGAAVQRVLNASQPPEGAPSVSPAAWDGALRQTLERYLSVLGAGEAAKILVLLPHGAARPAGLSPRFVLRDAEQIDALEGPFDAALVVDVASRLPQARRGLARLRAALKPGARILLVDACKREGISAAQERLLLSPLADDAGLQHLESAARYQRDLVKAGFALLETEDLSDRVRPGWQRDYRRALAAHRAASTPPTEASALPLDEVAARQRLNDSLRVRAAFDSGFLRYMLFLAEAA